MTGNILLLSFSLGVRGRHGRFASIFSRRQARAGREPGRRAGFAIDGSLIGATTGAFLTRYGVLWPVLTAFTLFALALPILLRPQDAQ